MSYNYNAGAGPGPGTGHHNNTFGDHDFAYDDKSFYCYPHYQQTHTAARTENLLIELRRLWDLWTVPRPLSQSQISPARVISLTMTILSLCWLVAWLSPPALRLSRPWRSWPLIIITQSIQGSLTSRHSNINIPNIRAPLSRLLKGSFVKIYQTQFRKQSPDQLVNRQVKNLVRFLPLSLEWWRVTIWKCKWNTSKSNYAHNIFLSQDENVNFTL